MEIVRLLLGKGAKVKTDHNYENSPLWLASQKGSAEIVKLLLAKGADVNAEHFINGTALWVACESNHPEVVKVLLEKGAAVNVKDRGTGMPAVVLASQKGYVEVVKLLLGKGVDVNAKDKDGNTALAWASTLGRKEIVQLLSQASVRKTESAPAAPPPKSALQKFVGKFIQPFPVLRRTLSGRL